MCTVDRLSPWCLISNCNPGGVGAVIGFRLDRYECKKNLVEFRSHLWSYLIHSRAMRLEVVFEILNFYPLEKRLTQKRD